MYKDDFERKSALFKFKIFVLLSLLIFFVFILRLFYLQIINRSYYKQLAESQQIVNLKVQGKRGNIFDCNGNLLVSDVFARSYALDPKFLRNHQEFIPQLINFLNKLGIQKDNIGKWLKSNRNFIWIKRGIFGDDLRQLDTFDFPGLIKLYERKRFHLFGDICSNIVGATNIDNQGISGIELIEDSTLSGKEINKMFIRDAEGRLKPLLGTDEPDKLDGASISLTIDINLQRIAMHLLKKSIENTNSKSGCIIIMNPNNGEILSLANYPTFNSDDISKSKNEELKIIAVNYAFEPGSTLKPIIASIALDNYLIDEHEFFPTFGGELDLGDVKIIDEHPTNQVTLEEALAFSSNIAFSQIASRIPPDLLIEGLLAFGFGKQTGIELPGELSGVLKSQENLSSTLIKYIGFGYGISVTPIQLITAYSVFANGGFMIKPHLIRNSDKIEASTNIPTSFTRRIISEETAKKIKAYLTKVVDYGTGKAAKIDGLFIAGKTGTAQKFIDKNYSKTSYVNTFVGFFPAENPQLTILILLDEPQKEFYAGTTTAPIFRNLVLNIYNSVAIRNLLH